MKERFLGILFLILTCSGAEASIVRYNFDSGLEPANWQSGELLGGEFNGHLLLNSDSSIMTDFNAKFTRFQNPEDTFEFRWKGESKISTQFTLQAPGWWEANFESIVTGENSLVMSFEMLVFPGQNPLERLDHPTDQGTGTLERANGETFWLAAPRLTKVPEPSTLYLLILSIVGFSLRLTLSRIRE